MSGTKLAPKLAGVIGWPVHHSLSPLMHNHWLKQHSIAGAYVALPIAPENFGRCVAHMPLMGFAGANVTVPHKQAAFALSASLDEDAAATGAVNTLLFEGGLIYGRNTDVQGFAASLAENLGKDAATHGPVVVLGAGGAARAVLLALIRSGAREIRIANRTKDRAEAVIARMPQTAKLKLVEWGDWRRAFDGAGLVINTTSLGMAGKSPLELSLGDLPPEAAVADIVYNPLETDLLKQAGVRGHRTMDGLGMLMHQAAPAFAAWFGETPEVTAALRAELVKALVRG
jgi:shikimate dehydrogenase